MQSHMTREFRNKKKKQANDIYVNISVLGIFPHSENDIT